MEAPEHTDLLASVSRLESLLREVLEAPPPWELPEEIRTARPDLPRLAAILNLGSWPEVLEAAITFKVDLRDLTPPELAWIYRVTRKTVDDWRSNSFGPVYRTEGGIRYPLRELWEWRQKNRQRSTAQGTRKGRRKVA